MVLLPDQYVTEKFCQHAGYPKYNKRAHTWSGGCPMCREGSSWGKKRRLYYKLDKNYVFCFNCGWKGSTLQFIKEITGMSINEIVEESNTYDNVPKSVDIIENKSSTFEQNKIPSLPHDSINLFDTSQTDYWLNSDDVTNNDKQKIKKALEVVVNRKLDTAINKPKSLWLSLTDHVHKNRLVIPFYEDKKIIFYQSRTIFKDENNLPKYLSKSGGSRSVFNIDNIDNSLDNMYIFEGPIDSCFVKNGIAIAGITNSLNDDLTLIQQQQLSRFNLMQRIWVLDSQWLDETSRSKTQSLLDADQHVFIWPEDLGTRYKDLNEMCVSLGSPGINYKFIDRHTYSGLQGKLLMSRI